MNLIKKQWNKWFTNVNGQNISPIYLMRLLMCELKSPEVYYRGSIIKL